MRVSSEISTKIELSKYDIVNEGPQLEARAKVRIRRLTTRRKRDKRRQNGLSLDL